MPASLSALPSGTRLEEFEILELVGEGGFGIVYLARDHMLQRNVALKEYMPSALATRTGPTTVSVKSEDLAGTFVAGLRSFVNEARLLARFDHPSLVKVYRFWEANGTAYMVMPFYEGVTVRAALLALGGPPTERWLEDLLPPLLDVLAYLHRAHCFYRDIAPDNILILRDGRPLLLDFGAQRAAYIRQRLVAEAPELGPRLHATGMGFRENIIGTGSDDARDALDRRVEFKVTEC